MFSKHHSAVVLVHFTTVWKIWHMIIDEARSSSVKLLYNCKWTGWFCSSRKSNRVKGSPSYSFICMISIISIKYLSLLYNRNLQHLGQVASEKYIVSNIYMLLPDSQYYKNNSSIEGYFLFNALKCIKNNISQWKICHYSVFGHIAQS